MPKTAPSKDDHIMTAREYMQTPEYEHKMREQAKLWIKSFLVNYGPTLDDIQRTSKGMIGVIESSGAVENIEAVIKRVNSMKITYEAINASLFAPPVEVRPAPEMARDKASAIVFSDDDIDRIVDKLSKAQIDKLHKLLDQITTHKISAASPDVFVLQQSGDLYRSSNPQKIHHFRGQRDGGMRLTVINALIGKKSFTSTRDLLKETRYVNAESLRKAIEAINRELRYDLKLKAGQDCRFIISHRPSGYMINSAYEVIDESDGI